MSHIAASPCAAGNSFHFVTWNDDGAGEYCLWSVARPLSEGENAYRFDYFPRLLTPRILDKAWYEVR
jgi:hypothetical protein